MKHLLSILAFVLCALPVFAVDYGLYVGGKQVVGGDSTFNVTKDGKIKYDPRSRTLTLRGAVVRDTVCAIRNADIDSLTILVEGTDSLITTGADGLVLERRTFLRSSSHDGLLYVQVGKAKKDSLASNTALLVGGGSTLRIADCYVQLQSDAWALRGSSQDSLAIVCAEVSVQTNDTLRSCIEGFKAMTLRSVYISSGEVWNAKTNCLCQTYNSNKKAQSALIQGSLYVGRYIVDVAETAKEQTITAACTGLRKGTVKYHGLYQMLTLANAKIETTGVSAIRNMSMNFLTIHIQGADTITSTGSDVFSLLRGTTLQGSGRDASRLVVKGSGNGIFQAGQPFGYALKVSNLSLKVEAAKQGIYGQSGFSQLTIENARLNVNGNVQAISSFASCTLTDDATANGTAWRQATGRFDHNDGTAAREVVIDVPTVYYPVSVLGHTLNNVDSGNFAADGISGTGSLSYDATTSTLSLSNVTIRRASDQGFYYPGAIVLSGQGSTVKVSGTNSIVHESGIVAKYGGTLTGSGRLDIEATEGSAIFTGSEDMFTVSCAALSAKGNEYGFNAFSRGGLTLAAAAGQTATTYTFSGRMGIVSASELTLIDMNISAPHYCYFDPDHGDIRQNGGEAVEGEATFSQVTTRYGVKIMGVEMDNCNYTGIGSPAINRKDYMTFQPDRNVLTLNSLDFTSTDETTILEFCGNGMQVVFNGTSTLTTNAGAAIKVHNPEKDGRVDVTFRGEGTVNAKGRFFAVLIGANAGVTFSERLVVNGEGAISGNNLGMKNETLTVEEEAIISCKGYFMNPGVEQLASITLRDRAVVVKPNHGSVRKFEDGYAVADRDAFKGNEVTLGMPQNLGMYIGELAMTTANYTDLKANGHFCYDPETKTLTLKNAVLDGTIGVRAAGIDNRQIDGLNIKLVGDNIINVNNNVITSEKNFSITGEGTLTGTSVNGVAMLLFGADCTVSGPKVSLTGKTSALRGDRTIERLLVENQETQLILESEEKATIGGLGAINLGQGLFITSPKGAVFSSDYGGLTVDGKLYSGKVIISNRESSAIDDVQCDASAPVAIYDHSGRKLREQRKGLNIIRRSDGTVCKQMVR